MGVMSDLLNANLDRLEELYSRGNKITGTSPGFAELDELDEEAIAAKRHEAEYALDQLHNALVERQAHLLNYEDMAHLQQCKIDLLSTVALAPSEATPPTEPKKRRPERSQREFKQPTASERPTEGRDRTTIEGDLLDKINQLQGRKKPKK